MLTCKDLTELITEYLEGRMGLMKRIRFQMHLGMCRHCRNYLRQMRGTIDVLGRIPEVSAPMEVEEELLKRFRDWKSRP